MNTIRFIGDTHLGRKFPYTTVASSIQFQQYQDQLLQSLSNVDDDTLLIQLGDLFNGFSVSDVNLVKGYSFGRKCTRVLSGNHDVSNNTEKSSAIALLKDNLGIPVVWSKPDKLTVGCSEIHLVPHQLTQALFNDALDYVAEEASRSQIEYKVLCLHCNFGDRPGTDTENYLTREKANLLRKTFHLIVSGHEHNYSEPLKGVVMLGSIMPFDFGQMSPKYIMNYNPVLGTSELIPTWSAHSYLELSASDFIGLPTEHDDISLVSQFIKVTGIIEVGDAIEINKKIASLYKNNSVYAIKNETVLHRHEKVAGTKEAHEHWLDAVLPQLSETQRTLLLEIAEGVK